MPRLKPRISLAGFKDPVRRPRYILWTLAVVLVGIAFMVVALGVTSTRWFCSEACHKVQDDTIIAYERSSHSQISCMSCHMPVGASPATFMLHKMEALGELYLTVTDQYSLPLNPESEVSLTMPAAQCTQCHNPELRPTTASKGIVIDHQVHTENEVTCAICHNRIAHNEDFELTLIDPNTGKRNRKHEDFMEMTACFRCHTQGEPLGEIKAPGACSACHPDDFELKPESHLEDAFFPKGHAALAKAEASRVAAFSGEGSEGEAAEGEAAEGEAAEGAAAEGEGEEGGHGGEGIGPSLPKVETINVCYTCHTEKFCSDCHGVPMPHPADFKESHGEYGKKNPEKCENCHGDAKVFCDQCHHGTELKWQYQAQVPWRNQHPAAVRGLGADPCFDCHDPTYCADCHVNGP